MHEIKDYPRPAVFFDGGCPLCMQEIAHYRRLDREEQIQWVDITRRPDQLAAHGLSLYTAMARFHVLDSRGIWQTGAWGFNEMWSHLPYYRWLARLLTALRLIPLLDKAYTGFARWRVRSRCGADGCRLHGED